MTPDRTPHPYRRASDAGRWGCFRRRCARAREYGSAHFQTIVSVSMIVFALGLGTVGVVVWLDQRATKLSARKTCQRSIRFGSLNEREHRLLGVYKPRDLHDFRVGIPHPDDCP